MNDDDNMMNAKIMPWTVIPARFTCHIYLVIYVNPGLSMDKADKLLLWDEGKRKVQYLVVGHKDFHINGLMQRRRNSVANALELHLFCIKPSIWHTM